MSPRAEGYKEAGKGGGWQGFGRFAMGGQSFGLWNNASFPGISACEHRGPHLLVPQVPAVMGGARWEALTAQEELLSVRWNSKEGMDGLCRGWVINSWSQILPPANSLQRRLFSASLSSKEIRYFILAFISVPTKDLQTSSSEAESDLSLREHVKGIIINVRKNKNKLAAKMSIIS